MESIEVERRSGGSLRTGYWLDGTGVMCAEGADTHGIPHDWIGRIEVHGAPVTLSHLIILGASWDGRVMVGPTEFDGMLTALRDIAPRPHVEGHLRKHWLRFVGEDGIYLPCPYTPEQSLAHVTIKDIIE
jgi:hypothetical protein